MTMRPFDMLRASTRPRSIPSNHAVRRTFSSSIRRRSAFVDVVTAPSMACLNTLHSIGLPWWAVIPGLALTTRSVVYFVSSRRSHKMAQIRASVAPVALSQLASEYTMRSLLSASKLSHLEPNPRVQPEKSRLWMMIKGRFQLRSRMGEIGRKIDNDAFRYGWPLVGVRIGAWLISNEAIRMKLGMSTGLIQTMYGFMFGGDSVSTGTATAVSDASTQLEGLSWCQDLTVADPTGILQVSVALVTMTNLLARPGRPKNETWTEFLYSVPQQTWTVALVMCVIYDFAWTLPAGLHLYWLSSMLVAKAQGAWLNYHHPIPPVPPRCKLHAHLEAGDVATRRRP